MAQLMCIIGDKNNWNGQAMLLGDVKQLVPDSPDAEMGDSENEKSDEELASSKKRSHAAGDDSGGGEDGASTVGSRKKPAG
eukprot:14768162-Alexandrium_andersonii.AAC.1